MSRRRHLILIALSLGLGLATTVGLALVLARFRPVPQYPRTVARAFILDGRAWSTAEVHLWGVTDIWWDDLVDGTAPPPKNGVERALALMGARPAAPSKTPEQLIAEARGTYAKLAQERDWFTALDTPPRWGTFAQPPPFSPLGTLGEDAAFGFPFPCLWYRVLSQARGNASLGATIEHGYYIRGTPNARATGSYVVLPLRPIWVALVGDAAVFAGGWWVVLAGSAIGRRVLRRRGGRCVACGYDLHATPAGQPCPECGDARRAVAP